MAVGGGHPHAQFQASVLHWGLALLAFSRWAAWKLIRASCFHCLTPAHIKAMSEPVTGVRCRDHGVVSDPCCAVPSLQLSRAV